MTARRIKSVQSGKLILVLTRHLGFGSLVIDRLAGQRVDSDLGDGHGGVLQLAVEPQDLRPLAGVLHHLKGDQKKGGGLLNLVEFSIPIYKKTRVKSRMSLRMIQMLPSDDIFIVKSYNNGYNDLMCGY